MFRGHRGERPESRSAALAILEEEQLRSEELETLFAISRVFTAAGAFEDKVQRALEEIVRVCQAWEVALRIPDEKAGVLRVLARTGPATISSPFSPPLAFTEGLSGAAWVSGEPAVSNDYPSDPRAHPTLAAQGTRSAVAIPVQTRGRTTAVAVVASREPGQFPAPRVRFLVAIVDGLAAFLENARLQEEERLHARELATLFTVSTILAGPEGFAEKVDRVLAELARVSQTEMIVLRVPDDRVQGLRLIGKAGSASPAAREVLPYGVGLSDTVYRTGEVIVSNDYLDDPRALPNMVSLGIRSSATMPVNAAGKTVGVLIAGSLQPGHFDERRMRLMTSVVSGLGTFLENARLYDELAERNSLLEQRVREVTVLNDLFQSHLNQRYGVAEGYEEVVEGLQGLVRQLSALLEKAQSQPLPDLQTPSAPSTASADGP